jgi:hypothetical protein
VAQDPSAAEAPRNACCPPDWVIAGPGGDRLHSAAFRPLRCLGEWVRSTEAVEKRVVRRTHQLFQSIKGEIWSAKLYAGNQAGNIPRVRLTST